MGRSGEQEMVGINHGDLICLLRGNVRGEALPNCMYRAARRIKRMKKTEGGKRRTGLRSERAARGGSLGFPLKKSRHLPVGRKGGKSEGSICHASGNSESNTRYCHNTNTDTERMKRGKGVSVASDPKRGKGESLRA